MNMLDLLGPFIGCWEATDGSSRQELAWGLDQRLIRTQMWFRDGDGWKLVSEGALYRDPGRDEVVGFAVAIEMPVTHFSITARAEGDAVRLDHVAYTPDGSPMETAERWQTVGSDRFTWQLFQRAGDELTPWMDGEWRRVPPG
jgi:hypothetical protein